MIKYKQGCEEKGIQPITGCEFYIDRDLKVKEKGDKRLHIVGYVESKKGWENILRLLTISNLEGMYRKPRVDPMSLVKHSEGLIFSSACASAFINKAWGRELMTHLFNINTMYLAIMPHDMTAQVLINSLCLHLSKEHTIPLTHTNDAPYPSLAVTVAQDV